MRPLLMTLVLFALALPAAVRADAPRPAEAIGRITAVEPESKDLTVLAGAGDHLQLRVDDRTKMQIGGRSVSLNDFVVGDPVKVRFEPGKGRQHALAITSDTTTARDVRDKMREALKTAGSYAYREKDKFKRKMHHVLEDLDAQIHRLQVKAKNSGEEARKRYAPQIEEMKKRARQVRKELKEADSVAADRWDDVKKGTASAMDKLSGAVDRAADWLRKK